MKKLTLVLCVVVAMAFTGMVFAQTATPPVKQTPAQPMVKPAEKPAPAPAPAKAAPEKPAVKPAAVKKMGAKKITGMVVSVDAVANTIVVKGKKAEMTFEVGATTKIMIAGKEAKLADLNKDTKVTVAYKMEGKKKLAIFIKAA
jgi:hypothetical protein